jgi:hypothetical protein
MGTHVILSGGAIKQLPVTASSILSYFIQNGGTITRLDIAVDCRDCGLRPQDATREITNEKVRTLARKFPLWHDAKTPGYTQYIGKKSSSAFCRIYDKAAEMGAVGDWTRVECSFAGKRAMAAAQACLRGEDYRGVVRGFVDFDAWKEWKEIMSIPPVPTKYERTLSKTKRWLLSSAAPSLARELYLDGDDSFYFQWIDHMRFFLDKLRHEENSELENDTENVA